MNPAAHLPGPPFSILFGIGENPCLMTCGLVDLFNNLKMWSRFSSTAALLFRSCSSGVRPVISFGLSHSWICLPVADSAKRRKQVRPADAPTQPIHSFSPASGHRVGKRWKRYWRRGRDSNPRYPFGHAGFQDRSHQPLGHLSASDSILHAGSYLSRAWFVVDAFRRGESTNGAGKRKL